MSNALATVDSGAIVAFLEDVQTALKRSVDIREVVHLERKGAALQAILRKAQATQQAQNAVAEAGFWLKRRVGEMLREMEKQDGGDAARARLHKATESPPKLADLGIEKTQSHRLQQVAALPEDLAREELDRMKASPDVEITTAAVVKAVRKKQHARTTEATATVAKQPSPAQAPTVQLGQWWKLGRHLLYCGDTSTEAFYGRLPAVAFAFADPPYNAEAAEWDKGFLWRHDWLADKAAIVAVTPGIESLFDFARLTGMPYKWSLACWIDNGMTRGAVGFGNWIYTALFAKGTVHRKAQDFWRISIAAEETAQTQHKGRKPAALLTWLIDTFANPGSAIIDPFLGSGTSLFAAEISGRTCYGGEISPDFCAEIVARWERMTGKRAEVMPRAPDTV